MAVAKQTDEIKLVNVKPLAILLQFLGEWPFHPQIPHRELWRAEQTQKARRGPALLLLYKMMLHELLFIFTLVLSVCVLSITLAHWAVSKVHAARVQACPHTAQQKKTQVNAESLHSTCSPPLKSRFKWTSKSLSSTCMYIMFTCALTVCKKKYSSFTATYMPRCRFALGNWTAESYLKTFCLNQMSVIMDNTLLCNNQPYLVLLRLPLSRQMI